MYISIHRIVVIVQDEMKRFSPQSFLGAQERKKLPFYAAVKYPL